MSLPERTARIASDVGPPEQSPTGGIVADVGDIKVGPSGFNPTTPTPARGMTEKQRETILTAHRMGYYETPRLATLDDLARVLDLSKAAVHNRLAGAERALVTDFVLIATEADRVERSLRAQLAAQHLPPGGEARVE